MRYAGDDVRFPWSTHRFREPGRSLPMPDQGVRRLAKFGRLAAGAALAATACTGPGRPGAEGSDPYRLGHPDAPVAVVEFSDFGCPYCARFARNTMPALRDEYVARGRVRWRYVPVVMGFPGGDLMGAAAVCTAQLHGRDAFWRVHDIFYERQASVRSAQARPLVLGWLAELGLDRTALDRCMDAPETLARLNANNQEAVRWNIGGTPTFVINGVPMSGAYPTAFFRQILDTVLDPSNL
jgi:protein-disulfide isomerase